MKQYKKTVYTFAICLGLISCEGGFELDPDAVLPFLDTITLVSPLDSEVCDVTLLESGSVEVRFQWSVDGEFTGEYTLSYTNTLNGNTQTVISNQQMIDVVLDPGVRYTWNVSAIVNGDLIEGNQPFVTVTPGLQEQSYPPYLSDIDITEEGGDSYQIVYSAIDPDGDTINFDIFMGTSNPPNIAVASNTSATQVSVNMDSNTTYYLRVVAKDGTGNETESSRSFTTP